jgi:hypothetical protein
MPDKTYINGDRVAKHSRIIDDHFQLVQTRSANDYADNIYIWNLKTDQYIHLEAVRQGNEAGRLEVLTDQFIKKAVA